MAVEEYRQFAAWREAGPKSISVRCRGYSGRTATPDSVAKADIPDLLQRPKPSSLLHRGRPWVEDQFAVPVRLTLRSTFDQKARRALIATNVCLAACATYLKPSPAACARALRPAVWLDSKLMEPSSFRNFRSISYMAISGRCVLSTRPDYEPSGALA